MKNIIITIDGQSACGKSTLAKDLAQELDYGYIDTGAMYRAVTYFFLENRVNIQKSTELERALQKINITFKSTVAGNRTYLNGQDVEDTIRKMFVSKNVSHVAAISSVRKMVVKQQKEMGRRKGIVMEGRDIGTVVFPSAKLKLFLAADEDVRTQRRYDEIKKKGQKISLKAVRENLRERDHIDSTRKDSPLKKAKEAILIDNSNLTRREQLQMTLALAKERIRQENIVPKKISKPVPKTKPVPNKNTTRKTSASVKATSQSKSNNATNKRVTKPTPAQQKNSKPVNTRTTKSTPIKKTNNANNKRATKPTPTQQKNSKPANTRTTKSTPIKKTNNANNKSVTKPTPTQQKNSKPVNTRTTKNTPNKKPSNANNKSVTKPTQKKKLSSTETAQKQTMKKETSTKRSKQSQKTTKSTSAKTENNSKKQKPAPRKKSYKKPTPTKK